MFYRKRTYFIALLLLYIATPVCADNTVDVSARVLNFGYEEFDQSGESYNQENGIIPGLSLSTSLTHNKLSSVFSFEVYDGQVDYDGQTQSGTPHTTNTDETQYRLFYMLGWSAENISSMFYGKFVWQQWDRDILPTGNVSGLFERYRWWTFEAGILTTLYQSEMDQLQFELGASKVTNGSIKIDLDAFGYGQPSLDLGDGSGLTSALKYRHQIHNGDDIGLSLEYRYWTFGRSNSKTISNNVNTITITEPRSESRQIILSVSYSHYF